MRDGWRETTLADICDLTKGGTPTMKARPGPYPLVVTAEGRGSSDEYQFDGEAVCVPMVSSTGHGHASLKRVHYESGKFAVANIITACTAKPGAPVDMKYLWLVLDHQREELIVPLMKGTANVSLSQKNLATVALNLPPLVEQRRIVDLIAALDDTIGAAEHLLASTPYNALLRQLVIKYPHRPISEVVSAAYAGGTPSRKEPSFFAGEIPWLKSGEVRRDEIDGAEEYLTELGVRSSAAKMVPAGATVVAMYGQGDTKGTAGFVTAPLTTNQAVLALLPDPQQVRARFLLHAVRSQTDALRSRAVGAAQPNLSKSLVLSHLIPLPDMETQASLEAVLDATLSMQSVTQTELQRLRDLRSNLLTTLLSGAHEIPSSYDDLLLEGVAA